MIFSLYPRCFQFAEQFRQTDIPGLISGLTGIDSQCISDKAFARTCSPDQNDIQPLADVVIICQALQKITVQVCKQPLSAASRAAFPGQSRPY